MSLTTATVKLPSPKARAGMALLSLPFDTIRLHYAACVQAGLIRRSILDSRNFERALGSIEQMTLGPLARRN